MKNRINKIILKIKLKFFPMLFNSNDMIKYLKANKVKIGNNCRFYRPSSINVDISRPSNIKIGNYCKITSNVTILAHDYSYSVARRVYGITAEKFNVTIIGDNVFIGMGSIILPGTQIGNNVIIGAGSIVRGIIPDNSVVAGNPAKVICSLEHYYNSRIMMQKEYAKEQYLLLKDFYKRKPSIVEMGNFYPLYIERDEKKIIKSGVRIKLGGDNETEVLNDLMNSKGQFSNYHEFCKWAEKSNDTVNEEE